VQFLKSCDVKYAAMVSPPFQKPGLFFNKNEDFFLLSLCLTTLYQLHNDVASSER
jgi:hypothetical protein